MPFGNIYDDENLRDPNRFKPDDQMMYAGDNPELRAMMKRPASGKAAAFAQRVNLDDPNLGTKRTVVANPNAGKLNIEGGAGGFTDTDMNAISRGAFRDYDLANARDTNGDGKPDWAAPKAAQAYNHTTGEYFEMAKSGPRISTGKAREFADRFKAEEAGREDRKAKNDVLALASRKLAMEESDSATRRTNAESDRASRQMMDAQTHEMGQNRIAQSEYDRSRGRRQDARSDAMELSPDKERAAATYRALIANEKTSDRVRAMASRGLASTSGLPDDIAGELGRPDPLQEQARATDVMAKSIQQIDALAKSVIGVWDRNFDSPDRRMVKQKAAALVAQAVRNGVPQDQAEQDVLAALAPHGIYDLNQ